MTGEKSARIMVLSQVPRRAGLALKYAPVKDLFRGFIPWRRRLGFVIAPGGPAGAVHRVTDMVSGRH